MKKTILALATSVFISGLILTSCNTTPVKKVEDAQKNVVQANRDLDQANKEYLADIENYRAETANRIAANDKAIAEFKTRMEHQKKSVKADYRKKIDVLEEKNKEMKRKMDNYKEEGKEKWVAFKTEFSHDMDELGNAFKDLTVKNTK